MRDRRRPIQRLLQYDAALGLRNWLRALGCVVAPYDPDDWPDW